MLSKFLLKNTLYRYDTFLPSQGDLKTNKKLYKFIFSF